LKKGKKQRVNLKRKEQVTLDILHLLILKCILNGLYRYFSSSFLKSFFRVLGFYNIPLFSGSSDAPFSVHNIYEAIRYIPAVEYTLFKIFQTLPFYF
jgi:hypothetical protein